MNITSYESSQIAAVERVIREHLGLDEPRPLSAEELATAIVLAVGIVERSVWPISGITTSAE